MRRWLWRVYVAVLCTLPMQAAFAVEPAVAGGTATHGMVAQITLDGPIGPAAAEYFDDAAQRAEAE